MANKPLKVLVLGGARSGKSAFAESLAEKLSTAPVYVATGEARDDEMTERIGLHKARRGSAWRTVEAPLDPLAAAQDVAKETVLLVDCLTLWLSNHLENGSDIDAVTQGLIDDLGNLDCSIVFVSNEIGLGLVPDTPLGRSFRDAQGLLNQRVAKTVDTVVFVAAGLPIVLKGTLP